MMANTVTSDVRVLMTIAATARPHGVPVRPRRAATTMPARPTRIDEALRSMAMNEIEPIANGRPLPERRRAATSQTNRAMPTISAAGATYGSEWTGEWAGHPLRRRSA
jgi:hypothetical protein